MKKHLLESIFNTVAGLKARNVIKKRPRHRYFPVNFPQFFKKPYLQNTFRWLLLLIPLFHPKFYALITLRLFFLSFFPFIIDNCNYGSLLKKCLKMKIFLVFTKVYSNININIVQIIRLGSNLPTHIRENTDFLWQNRNVRVPRRISKPVTYQKKLLQTLFCLFLKLLKASSVSLKSQVFCWVDKLVLKILLHQRF